MANNRITYATAQLSIKNNKTDPTSKIMGTVRDVKLAANIAATQTANIRFKELNGANANISGVWGSPGMFKIKTGAGTTEYIRYTSFSSPSGVTGVTRGASASVSGAHLANDRVQLAGWEVPLGVQSVSIGTNFNLEDVFTLGQLDSYENVEGLPEIEVSVERVFDGTKPLYMIVTDPDQSTLKGRTANYKVDLALSVYPDVQDSARGTPDSTVVCSGIYISAWSAAFSTDGNFTESVTLVGNDKSWGGQEGIPSGYFPTSDSYSAIVIGSGVQRSEDFSRPLSTLPTEVSSADHIQSIEVSVDITREDIFQLGQKTPFFKSVSFPITITTTFTVVSDKGDLVNALGTGVNNLVPQQIEIVTKEGLHIELGAKNKISSVTFEGFDAGGGNGTVTVEYTNSNHLTISHTGFPESFSTNDDPLR